jgi:hypothetical protein
VTTPTGGAAAKTNTGGGMTTGLSLATPHILDSTKYKGDTKRVVKKKMIS